MDDLLISFIRAIPLFILIVKEYPVVAFTIGIILAIIIGLILSKALNNRKISE